MTDISKKILKNIRLANFISNNNLESIKNYEYLDKDKQKEKSRKSFLASCLLMSGSLDVIRESFGSIRLAKNIKLNDYKKVLSRIESTSVSTLAALVNILNEIEINLNSSKEKPDLKKLRFSFIKSIEDLTEIISTIYDFSENIMFKKNNKDYYALQDDNLYKWSKDIIDFLKSKKKIVDMIKRSKDSSISKIGFDLEKAVGRLEGHLKRVSPVDDLIDEGEMIRRVANKETDIL